MLKDKAPLRKCIRCGKEAHTPEALDLFVLDRVNRCKHDRRNMCRECRRKTLREEPREQSRLRKRRYNAKHKDDRHDFYLQNREKILAQHKHYRETHREERRVYYSRYFEEHRKEHHAQSLAWRKIPLDDSCSLCGATENLQRHHPDYDKPLEVITVCAYCHS